MQMHACSVLQCTTLSSPHLLQGQDDDMMETIKDVTSEKDDREFVERDDYCTHTDWHGELTGCNCF